MKNVFPSFETLVGDTSELPPGYQKTTCLVIFDVKMGEHFRRKASFVAIRQNTRTLA